MDIFYSQIINILTNPPGNLIYHIVLAFAITAALQGILISHRSGQDEALGRALFGLGLVLAGQVGLFLISGLAWQGLANPHVFLPPLDRAITLFSLLWIVWMWAFPHTSRLGDALTGVTSVVLVIAFFFTLNLWSSQPSDLAYNGTDFDLFWQLADLIVMGLGCLILFVRRPIGWGVGLGFILVNLAGHTAHFLWPANAGDFAGAIRLAQLCSYPLLPTLAQRVLPPAPQSSRAGLNLTQFKVAPLFAGKKGALEPGTVRERRRYSADPRATQAWLSLAAQAAPNEIPAALTRAVAQTMLADICFLVNSPDPTAEVLFTVGYDLIREEVISNSSIPREKLPAIAAALQRGRSFRLEPGSTTPDLKTLGDHFGLGPLSNLLLIPLANQKTNLGGFLFLSPYSNREWSASDQSYFASATEPLIQLMLRSTQQSAAAAPAGPVSGEVEAMRLQVQSAQEENKLLLTELHSLRHPEAPNVDLEALLVVQKEAQETIASLQSENERLTQALQSSAGSSPASGEGSAASAHLEAELRQTLQEVARLQNKLAHANAEILILENKPGQSPLRLVNEEREVVASIAQDLRQPMASITGYTELLLSESAGILGALQRKFMERIKTSIERMHTNLDDLVQVTSLEGGKVKLSTQSVDAAGAIDQAIAETRAQMQAKNITLQIDIPEELPQLFADRDAVLQILIQLLQNASLATPVEGTITLKVRIDDRGASNPYLLCQITDSGGGIASQDLSRVFSRRYRADNPLIQGVGDTGVGLSIAKTLTEAHGGRIWVESEPGKTSTFSVLLPVHTDLANPIDQTAVTGAGPMEGLRG